MCSPHPLTSSVKWLKMLVLFLKDELNQLRYKHHKFHGKSSFEIYAINLKPATLWRALMYVDSMFFLILCIDIGAWRTLKTELVLDERISFFALSKFDTVPHELWLAAKL